ncbi:L-threonine dehydratase catabolic TdcB-like [Amblyraja radiata]|uniref:L-threonine dehydratase catabolic TdcB-like n=1 Tax=Amblyraja radiata TaxID=386614 RepID=UPI0014038359|nr:L-threonine dehydratase catabolic TdcB-like [Amblyraja radiata]
MSSLSISPFVSGRGRELFTFRLRRWSHCRVTVALPTLAMNITADQQFIYLVTKMDAVEGAAQSPQPASDDSQRQRQRDDPTRNRYAGQRPINPERLKDFGEDEYVGKDVKTWELTVTGHSETLLNTGQDVTAYKASRSPEPCTRQAPFEDIRTAAFKIQHGIQKTPCTYSRLSKQYGMEIYLKKEYLHHTGSVKERGVWYLLTSLSQEQQRKGVILASDNDFSKAVAHHATELHVPVFIILSANTPPGRVKTCREYGAMVITYGSGAEESRSHAQKLATENGYLYLQEEDSTPYLAGLGTMGLEVYEQVNKLDAVILPAGGQRHILAGAAAPIKHLNPGITIIGVVPENYPTLQQSLGVGPTMKESAYTSHRFYGELFNSSFGSSTCQMSEELIDKVVTVKEADILVSMLRLMEYERATVDATGAIGLAAVIAGKLPELKGKRVVIAVCSGNVDVPLMRACLDRALVLDNRMCKFSIQMCDNTGDLAKLLEVLTREEVRVLDVIQERSFVTSDIFSIKVTSVIEVRDRSQMVQVERTLRERYTNFTWVERAED